jgi:hypothetical protein
MIELSTGTPMQGFLWNNQTSSVKNSSEYNKTPLIKYDKMPQDFKSAIDDIATVIFDVDGGHALVIGYPLVGKTFLIEQFIFNAQMYLNKINQKNLNFITLTKKDFALIELTKGGFSSYLNDLKFGLNCTNSEICFITESSEIAANIQLAEKDVKIILEMNISTFMQINKSEQTGRTKIWSSWGIIDANRINLSKDDLVNFLYNSLIPRISLGQKVLSKKNILTFVNFCIKKNPELMIHSEGEEDKSLIPIGLWSSAIRRLHGVMLFYSDPSLNGSKGNKIFNRVVNQVYSELEEEFEIAIDKFRSINEDDDIEFGEFSEAVSNALKKIGITGVEFSETFERETPNDGEKPFVVKDIHNLYDRLRKKVIGQDEAVKAVSDGMLAPAAGINDDRKPLRSFLFLGQTGVGKTKLALSLAEEFSSPAMNVIRIDMGEYTESHEAAKLFGAPPGYLGYDDGGILTSAVLKNPHSLILLDEVEKAHPKIWDSFLQVLDAGRMTDSSGKVVDFSKTIIVMTSNLGVNEFNKPRAGFLTGADSYQNRKSDAESYIKKAVKTFFKSEFVNRIDEIVIFNELPKEIIIKIIQQELAILSERMKKKGTILKDPNSDILNKLFELSDVSEYGAREIQRVISKNVSNSLARKMLSSEKKREFSLVLQDGLIEVTAL